MTLRWGWVVPYALALATGCGASVQPATTSVPVVPVSFEQNLVTAKQCEYVGIAGSAEHARSMGANLVLAFENVSNHVLLVVAQTTKGETRTGVGVGVETSDFRGKAVRCPNEVIERVLAMPGSAEE